MSSELNFVLEVEKHECLYNYKLPEYSRKDLIEKAWTEVGKKTKLSVSECKEKWRNIRSSFIRSMKASPSGSKPRKPYYLKEYLQFILPYVKTTQPTQNSGNIPEVVKKETQEVVSDDDYEEPDKQTETYNPVQDETDVAEPTPEKTETESSEISAHPLTGRRRKRPVAESEQVFINYLKKKTKKIEKEKTGISESNNATSATHHFLMSLQPDIETMTEQQKRTFKIKVLMLIEEIKSHQGPYPFPSYSTATFTRPSSSSSAQATVSTPLISPQTSTQFSPICYTRTNSSNPEEHVPEPRNINEN